MRSVADGGRTVIFVSHNHSLISSLCTRALWLDNGRVRDEGDVDGVLERYASSFQDEESPQIGLRSDRIGSGRIKLDRVELRNGRGELLQRVATAEPLELVLDYVGEGDQLTELQVTVTAETLLREPVFTLSNRFTGDRLEGLPPGGSVRCVIDELPLNEGDYMWTVRLEVDGKTADFIGDTSRFHVDPRGFFPTGTYPGAKGGPLLLRHSWHAGKARR
jgi:lipopolysaccharide transport system ATP-binding protein